MPDWFGLPATGVAWGFALYVFLIAPRTLAARLLVAMLVVDGLVRALGIDPEAARQLERDATAGASGPA